MQRRLSIIVAGLLAAACGVDPIADPLPETRERAPRAPREIIDGFQFPIFDIPGFVLSKINPPESSHLYILWFGMPANVNAAQRIDDRVRGEVPGTFVVDFEGLVPPGNVANGSPAAYAGFVVYATDSYVESFLNRRPLSEEERQTAFGVRGDNFESVVYVVGRDQLDNDPEHPFISADLPFLVDGMNLGRITQDGARIDAYKDREECLVGWDNELASCIDRGIVDSGCPADEKLGRINACSGRVFDNCYTPSPCDNVSLADWVALDTKITIDPNHSR